MVGVGKQNLVDGVEGGVVVINIYHAFPMEMKPKK
jgi:hypothetical protein